MLLDVDRIIILSGLYPIIKKLLAWSLSSTVSYTPSDLVLRFFPSLPSFDALTRSKPYFFFNLTMLYIERETFFDFKLEGSHGEKIERGIIFLFRGIFF